MQTTNWKKKKKKKSNEYKELTFRVQWRASCHHLLVLGHESGAQNWRVVWH
jgi:hypothetical protein